MRRFTIFTIMALLFVLSLSIVSAANNTINPTTSGGIDQGIVDTGDGDTLFLENGTYNKSTDRGITINKNITIQGSDSPENTIIDAQNLNNIFTTANGLKITFINITFTNGFKFTGGAIYNNQSQLTFINCIFTNNTATSSGGAIYNNGGANMSVTNSSFTNNDANSYGGAIYSDGGANMSVTNSSFTNNTGGFGGAIANTGDNMFVANSSFQDNYGNFIGGGILNDGVNFTVINSSFTNNTGDGGAIDNDGDNMSVINSTFTHNNGTILGGAIANNGDNMIIANSSFTGNNAAFYGGAIISDGVNDTVINSSFTNNTANSLGGAIYNDGFYMNIINSSFTGNNATSHGGAIFNNALNLSVINSSFINNTATGSGGAIYNILRGNNTIVVGSIFINNKATNNGGAIFNNCSNVSVSNSSFNDNQAGYGGGIYNNGSMLVSGNPMDGNTATILGNEIYNNGNMSVLNLTFIDNSTIIVQTGDTILLYANLTDDMGNLVTGGNISFYVNGNLIAIVSAIEGKANVTYTVNQSGKLPVTGNYDGVYTTINTKNGLLINKIETSITVNAPKNNTVNKPFNITGILTDKNNNPIKNATVIITIDNKQYTVVTDNFGRYSLMYTPTKVGELNISANYLGDELYLPSSNSVLVFVKNSTIPEPNNTTNKNESSNNSDVHASMKDTGIPIIAVLLVFLLSLGFIARKK
ncbi:hypothetical protein KQY27_01725 [Methanobrevibacter sp. TMH8]|uniref:beta strand repeat-containing protein n=1 Tax=Methanobrevibacter sp. TMH8 TaxID=2848611 RepID=UPI001CCFB964|nr:Ig-like domain repeat protein [Methanobrevibacter sp. TMH8]MBZ9570266.1 hypothetical protein [Methanobrevibacter sp. TMH8]